MWLFYGMDAGSNRYFPKSPSVRRSFYHWIMVRPYSAWSAPACVVCGFCPVRFWTVMTGPCLIRCIKAVPARRPMVTGSLSAASESVRYSVSEPGPTQVLLCRRLVHSGYRNASRKNPQGRVSDGLELSFRADRHGEIKVDNAIAAFVMVLSS